ncbi:dienelactone hydrolase family protein [Stutzerimonas zhaodongensis]|uniref:Dienelactone hydrolase family protein n=1 Tax=Stutzerimonas zhaodongensis TaxID=1176257 RepID=A0A3M2HPW0_9GAMM|nr:dienelactone hydrolase family protein [Stutzerimonas zhaodongensis]MCQ4317897.1 dienelactone hydrolase family protein [Stutzerimonas zhaodongensis]RMH88297.1 dienelactone hydrolase family protein [Stutzerimonas zhaodongensis]
MTSQWIDIPAQDGKTFKGYLALPPAGHGPGIVLIQEIFGVNEHIQSVADQYASDGYVVLAPDLFWRSEPGVQLGYDGSDWERAFALMKELDFDLAIDDLRRSAELLRERDDCNGRVASVGYCMGGVLSFLSAANAGVDAAVCYYPGSIEKRLDQAERITCPTLFHFAEEDDHIDSDAVDAVQEKMAQVGQARIETYPGVDHGFNCWARPAYNQYAAALAHGRTLVFLAENL